MMGSVESIIIGAGIAGISSAYHLAVKNGLHDILIIDEGSPLSLTSDKSTECYRNWWPGPGNAMVALMNRSIAIMEELADESQNRFHLNRRGYLYLTADVGALPNFIQNAKEPSSLGAGELREHPEDPSNSLYLPSHMEGYRNQPSGADLLLNSQLIHKYYPYLSKNIVAALHVRNAGWFSAQQLGMHLLDLANTQGVKLLTGRVEEIEIKSNRVQNVKLSDGTRISANIIILAGGPMMGKLGEMVGIKLPVFCELHQKIAINDKLEILHRNAPLLIWNDPQWIPWSSEEKPLLAEAEETRWLLNNFPPGIHTRPEGGEGSHTILILWEYRNHRAEPVFPPALDNQYPDIVLRGLSTMIPGMAIYRNQPSRPYLDGGYYTKTPENRPIIGPTPIGGLFIIGALSGYGLMSACAAGELLAAHVTRNKLPDYSSNFLLSRFDDPDYLKLFSNMTSTGQL